MANPSAADVRIAPPKATGGVLVAALATALPTSAAGATTGFTGLGYADESGVELTIDESTKSLSAWGGDVVRRIQESHAASLKVTLIESNVDALKFVFGAANVAATMDGHKVTIQAGQRDSVALIIDALDGDWGIRLTAANALVTSLGSIPLTHTDAVKFEVTIDLLPDSSGAKAYLYIEDVSV